MWLFTKYGFYSVVSARQGDGGYSQPVDDERMMVRARMRNHLESLRERFVELLGPSEIQVSQGTDYAYRLFVPKSNWSQVVAELANETDYDNFKSAVAKHQGANGTAYNHALHDVWTVMNWLQK